MVTPIFFFIIFVSFKINRNFSLKYAIKIAYEVYRND